MQTCRFRVCSQSYNVLRGHLRIAKVNHKKLFQSFKVQQNSCRKKLRDCKNSYSQKSSKQIMHCSRVKKELTLHLLKYKKSENSSKKEKMSLLLHVKNTTDSFRNHCKKSRNSSFSYSSESKKLRITLNRARRGLLICNRKLPSSRSI